MSQKAGIYRNGAWTAVSQWWYDGAPQMSAVSQGGLAAVGMLYGEHAARYHYLTGFALITIGGADARDITYDGEVAVGIDDDVVPVKWTNHATTMQTIATPPGVLRISPTAISGDGTVIVGGADMGSGYRQAFRMTSSGTILLGPIPGWGGDYIEATDCSADGNVIVGLCRDFELDKTQAFVWTPISGMQGIGSLSLSGFGFARQVSGDGSTIIGTYGESSFVWTQAGGIKECKQFLHEKGLITPPGWSIASLTGLSYNARQFVGEGTNPYGTREGFVVDLEPSRYIQGSVRLEDWMSTTMGTQLELSLVATGTNNATWSTSATLGNCGDYFVLVPAEIPTGTYDLKMKSSHWLGRRILNVHVGSAETFVELQTLMNGDVDGDNEVGIGDYAILSSAYGSDPSRPNWNANADLDGDGHQLSDREVGIGDYAVLSANYGAVGDD